MKTDILRAAVNRAPTERTVTLLGATGSVGASTIDLLKRQRERFRVDRLEGLFDEPRPGAPRSITDTQVEKVITKTLESMPANSTHGHTR